MRRMLLAVGATVVAGASLVWILTTLDPRSIWFAFLVVWLPMTWLGTVGRVARPRLPDRFHRLRTFERSGRLYEVLGVRIAKRLLRRGPLAAFNPGLHLPAERTAERLRRLDEGMRAAEVSHFILLVVGLLVSVHAAARGWWAVAAWTLFFNVLMNGYPVMLQRYNRALLHQRFAVGAEARPVTR